MRKVRTSERTFTRVSRRIFHLAMFLSGTGLIMFCSIVTNVNAQPSDPCAKHAAAGLVKSTRAGDSQRALEKSSQLPTGPESAEDRINKLTAEVESLACKLLQTQAMLTKLERAQAKILDGIGDPPNAGGKEDANTDDIWATLSKIKADIKRLQGR